MYFIHTYIDICRYLSTDFPLSQVSSLCIYTAFPTHNPWCFSELQMVFQIARYAYHVWSLFFGCNLSASISTETHVHIFLCMNLFFLTLGLYVSSISCLKPFVQWGRFYINHKWTCRSIGTWSGSGEQTGTKCTVSWVKTSLACWGGNGQIGVRYT